MRARALALAWLGGCGDATSAAADAARERDGDGADGDGAPGDRADGGVGPDAARGPRRLGVDPERPRWLYWDDGRPLYLCGPGDPEDFLYRGERKPDGTRTGDQEAIIDKIAPTGANGLYFQAVRSHGGDGDATHNPFVDSDPALGLDQDILDQWDTWLDALEAAGVVSLFFLYDDSALVWDTGDTVGEEERAFVEALVDRFEHHGTIVWAVAEEYGETISVARASAVAAAIREADDFDHPIAVHQNNGLAFDFPDDPNVDQFAIQWNVSTAGELHAGVTAAFASAAGRYNLNLAEAADHGAGAVAREKNWAAALGGAYVMVLGWDVATTDIADLGDCGRLVAFMESAGFDEMEPHDELGFGAAAWVLALPGERYAVYARESGDLGLGDLPDGLWELAWLDPATGGAVEETVAAAGDATFARPAALGAEVALLATRSGR